MPQQNQSQQRGNSSNISHNQPDGQANSTSSYARGLHDRRYGQPDQRQVEGALTQNTSYDPQPPGHQHHDHGGSVFGPGAPVQPQAPTRGNGVPAPSHSNNICKIPDCNQIRFFNQPDYCEAHIGTALRGYAATCKECRKWPVLENSEYCYDCGRFCAGGAGGSSTAFANVPQGFAQTCQDCRRAIMEGKQIYGGKYCSTACSYYSTHSPRR